jgi:squalene-hopene/tetraprenyl-beta-curcumene cyclase
VDDPWEKGKQRIPPRQFGSGCVHDWSWFFEGQSSVDVKSVEDVCRWLSECRYAHDKTLFNQHDFWQHPRTFETTRKGDCEDHALWAWRKLTELGYEAEFVRGRYFDGRDLHGAAHAAVIFVQNGRRYFPDTVAKGGRSKMVMPIATARALFCPECSVDSSFQTHRYAGRTLILQRNLRGGGNPKPINTLTALFISAVLWAALSALGAEKAAPPFLAPKDLSFRNEVQHAIDRGIAWLQANQNTNGWWSTADQPAVTALALMAVVGEPSGRFRESAPEWVKRGYAYVFSCAQLDGGIHRTNLVTYNTAICLMALLAANEPDYEPTILNARRFLIRLQGDFGEKGRLDSPFDGGIGYGTKYEHSDMGNTLQALEAIYYSRHLAQDKGLAEADLNWQAAIHFLQSCQNLPSHNPQQWASDDPQNKGGFVYYPGHSMAGSVTNLTTGRVALRSYGSISYGGLLSYIYARLQRDDPRVVAVFDWLRRNYTLAENPAMGPQGLFYYYHTMAKALTAYGVIELELADGRKVAWRRDLAQRLFDLQQPDGSWVNENGRWWEKDPALVTAYAVLTLELIHRGL